MPNAPDRRSSPTEPSASDDARGLVCRACGCRHFYTTHTEPLATGKIRRRKICRHCGHPKTTYEVEPGDVKR